MATDVAAGSQTLDRALCVLMRIGESGSRGLTLAECSASLGYSKPTAHRILRTLAARGFLRVDQERGLYTLGPANLRLGMTFLEQLDIRTEALPVLRQLGERTGETVHLGVLDGSDVVYIEKIESKHAVRMFSRIGHTMPAYSTGIGKAILAHLRADELEQALPEKLEPRTTATITVRETLLRHLADIRRRGYSTDDVENEEGIRCVGAPVFDHSGLTCAGISVAGPASRVTSDRFLELGELVQEAAMAVSLRIGYDPVPRHADLFETG
jgi:DNA-binding IclR family transcriptional regulator